jgi:hypothetical protein
MPVPGDQSLSWLPPSGFRVVIVKPPLIRLLDALLPPLL